MVLLGFPLGHSLSPAIHNASFASQGLPFVYGLRPVESSRLGNEIARLKDAGFAGANVTVPHKQSVLDHVDSVSPTVEAVGAANTLVWNETERTLYADNTDVGGFLETLRGSTFLTRPCVILGNGGSARAVAYGLAALTDCPSITIAGRNPEKAEALVDSFTAGLRSKLESTAIDEAGTVIQKCGMVVNATPVGMSPNIDASPLPRSIELRPGQLAYDLIYNPSETRFMKDARDAGAEVVGGLEMLIRQAALSYRMWTGEDMDLESARAAVNS